MIRGDELTAMVFAAGLGTRMRPITASLPKPLVKVAGKALIDHMLDRLAEAGVREAVVNVHYLGGMIISHLAKREQAPRVVISDERDRLLDQGGAIMRALPRLGPDAFVICNTDALWIPGGDWTLARLFDAWAPERMDALLLVAASSASVGVDWPGDFRMDPSGRLTKRGEREIAPFVYAGVGLMKASLFAGETREVFRLAPTFFEAAARGRLHGVRLDGRWLHVGSPRAILEAEAELRESRG